MRVEIVEADRARALRRTVLRPFDPPTRPCPATASPTRCTSPPWTTTAACSAPASSSPTTGRSSAPAGREAAGPAGTCARWPPTRPAAGEGAGSAVLEAVIAYVAERDGMLWCHARVPAIPFYERHGFVAVGDVHPSGDPPIPHQLHVPPRTSRTGFGTANGHRPLAVPKAGQAGPGPGRPAGPRRPRCRPTGAPGRPAPRAASR